MSLSRRWGRGGGKDAKVSAIYKAVRDRDAVFVEEAAKRSGKRRSL